RLARTPEAGVAEGAGAPGADHAARGGAARRGAHQGSAGPGERAPAADPARHSGAPTRALCHRIFCLARPARAEQRGRVSRTHTPALPEWPGLPGTWEHEGREWLYADHGSRDCMGLGPLSAGEQADAVVSGPVWTGECAPAENWDCRAGPEAPD